MLGPDGGGRVRREAARRGAHPLAGSAHLGEQLDAARASLTAPEPAADPQHLVDLVADGERRVEVGGGVLEDRGHPGPPHLVPGAPAGAGELDQAETDVMRLSATQRVRKGLVRTFQVTRLFSEMTPEEHVAIALVQREGKSGRLFGTYADMPVVVSETRDILGTLGLLKVSQEKVREIAYGQQRLLEIALAMALRPKVLLLDEPAAGVPQSDTGRIEEALARLPPDLAVLMIEHDMDLVFRFAKRVVVLAAGTVIFDGLPEDVVQDARVREAYLGSYAQ